MAYYVDTSAVVKLVVEEAESAELLTWLTAQTTDLVASDLTRTELLRATRRTAPDRAVRAREVLDSLTLMTLPTALFERAGALLPDSLRSLDALHLAAALHLGDDLDGLVTYDDRLADAARSNGVRVVAPGLPDTAATREVRAR